MVVPAGLHRHDLGLGDAGGERDGARTVMASKVPVNAWVIWCLFMSAVFPEVTITNRSWRRR